jgi:hypothetical protein
MERILQDFEIISSQIHTEFLTFFTQPKKGKEERIGKMETITNKTIKSPLENMFPTHTCKPKNIKTKLKS